VPSITSVLTCRHRAFASGCCLALLGSAFQGCVPIVVGGAATGVSVAHDRRTAGTILDDQSIELKVSQRLAARSEFAEHSRVEVTCYNNAVLLTGRAETPDLSAQIATMVGQIGGVRRVINEIEIGYPASFGRDSEDTYITTKVKTQLFKVNLAGFDPTRVTVVTSNGVVYLLGLVTEPEATAAVNEARIVSGVRKVVRAFEYVSD
jgi:osmotically-inducible protein OsmY